jgi:hypothetical protein
MTISAVIETSKQLVFAQVIKVHADCDAPWIIAAALDLGTLKPVHPKRCLFINATVLRTKFQPFQLGPFTTPCDVDLSVHGLPKLGDTIVGDLGSNYKGEMYLTWLPDRWARPVSYFFYYLANHLEASQLYEHREQTLRMILLGRLTVFYGQLRDERLYDLLCLILFDNTEALISMCLKPQARPKNGRLWNLTDKQLHRALASACAAIGGKEVYIPTVPAFIEGAAYLASDGGICAHFKSVLAAEYQESKAQFQRDVGKWLADPECLSSKLIQSLVDQKGS